MIEYNEKHITIRLLIDGEYHVMKTPDRDAFQRFLDLDGHPDGFGSSYAIDDLDAVVSILSEGTIKRAVIESAPNLFADAVNRIICGPRSKSLVFGDKPCLNPSSSTTSASTPNSSPSPKGD